MSEIQIAFQDLTLGGKPSKLISFMGQLDETNVDHEAKQIYQVITEMPVPVLLLDFSGLEYMNSKSIGYVTDWYTQASAKGGAIGIVSPKPNILDILKVVGITQIITVYTTLDEAKVALGGGGMAAPAAAPAPAAVAPAAPMAPAAPAPSAPVASAPVPSAPMPTAPAAPSAPSAPAAPAQTPVAAGSAPMAPAPSAPVSPSDSAPAA